MNISGRNTIERTDSAYIAIGVAANTEIVEGSLVAVNSEGYAVPASKMEGLTVVGRAERCVNNVAAEDGYEVITVKRGCFKYDNSEQSPVTGEHLFKPCYVEDNTTVSSDSTGSYPAGLVIGIEADGVWVDTSVYIPAAQEASEAEVNE